MVVLLAAAGTAYVRRGPSSWRSEPRPFTQVQTVRVALLRGCLRVTSSGTLRYQRGVDRTRFVRGLSVVDPTTLVKVERCVGGELPATVGRLDLAVRWTTAAGDLIDTRRASYASDAGAPSGTWASYSAGDPVLTRLRGRSEQCIVAQPFVTPHVAGSSDDVPLRPVRICTS